MMWFLLLLLHTALIELVIPQALILRNTGGTPCKGHLEVYYKNTWGYVGDADWSENTEKVVCKSTHCGEPVKNSTVDTLMPSESRTIWLNELQCKGNENTLWECHDPGWNASSYQQLTVKKVQCSSNIKISLDRSECAGAVRFSDGETSGYFCNNGWDEKVASVVCKNLGCNGFKEIPVPEHMHSEAFTSSKTKMKLDCSVFHNQEPDNLWQCVTGYHNGDDPTCNPAAVICKGHQRLQLKGNQSNVCSGQLEEEQNGAWVSITQSNISSDVCQEMHCGTARSVKNNTKGSVHVTCTDEVKVVLMDSRKESKCYGTVNIRVNGSVKPVCHSSWRKDEAEFVCKELNCGKLIYFTHENLNSKGVMDHVKCSGSESSLWHCQAQRGKHVECSAQPKVVCSDSVKVKLVDGPGRCAGRLAIEFEGQWRRVANTSWTQSDTVCKQLKCGNNGKPEKFSQGSGSFMSINCETKQVSDISECLTPNSNRRPSAQEGEAVGITCGDHKMVFLDGNKACSGQVGIRHGNEIYWLSGSNATWNNESANTVCQQMRCGSAISFSSESAEDRSVWSESRNCSSSKESLFGCDKITPPPPDHQNSTASVSCSGKIEMNLTNGCWGKVQVYTQGVWGDMCADTWTEEMSGKLCAYLNCGMALKPHNSPRNGDIQFNSLHAARQNTELTQWNFVKTQDNDKSCNQRPAYVVCSDSVKARFSTSSGNCFGNIELEYEGQWLPVCANALKDTTTQNVICQKLNCGDAVKLLPCFGPAPAVKRYISSISRSPGAASSLSAHTIATSQSGCECGGLQCADWKVMVPNRKACSGTVLVRSGKGISAVSGTGWTETEKKRLCRHINCGAQSTDQIQDQRIEVSSFWNKSFRCANDSSTNIWECEQKTPPSGNNTLFIKCQGEPSVTMSPTQHCRGEVKIDGIPVCSANWDLSYADKVCHEKHCGNAISVSKPRAQSSRDAYYVSCDRYHSILGQCRRIKGKCDKSAVSISCSDSVMFRTTEKNGGDLEVNYRDKWEKVCHSGSLSNEINALLCEEVTKTENHNVPITNQQGSLETTLECPEGFKDVKRCVRESSCRGRQQTRIFCEGYIPPASPTEPPTTDVSTASIIVGVVLLLLVAILIVLIIRFLVRRARKSRDSSRMLSTKDMEYESGEYEDVMDKENEMEDFGPNRLRSNDEFITENDGHSVSSLPYDDIDEADEARPLTSPGAAAPADQDVNVHEDGVTYEVEDPQESYDDIDTIHEPTQTKADVHDSPQTTQDTAAPPGLAQRDEDYIEPDQDG